MKKVLVTGGTGFLGKHLVSALVKKGCQVTVLTRQNKRNLKESTVDYIEPGELIAALEKIDLIIHAATCYGREGSSVEDIYSANLLLGINLLEAVKSRSEIKIININSFFTKNVYVEYMEEYAASKYAFSKFLKKFAIESGITAYDVVLEHVYGPGDSSNKFITFLLSQLLADKTDLKLRSLSTSRDYIYIDDVCSAICLLAEKIFDETEKWRTIGLGSGIAVSLNDLCVLSARLANFHYKILKSSTDYCPTEIESSCADTAFLQAIGWTPETSLEAGLYKTIKSLGLRNGS